MRDLAMWLGAVAVVVLAVVFAGSAAMRRERRRVIQLVRAWAEADGYKVIHIHEGYAGWWSPHIRVTVVDENEDETVAWIRVAPLVGKQLEVQWET